MAGEFKVGEGGDFKAGRGILSEGSGTVIDVEDDIPITILVVALTIGGGRCAGSLGFLTLSGPTCV